LSGGYFQKSNRRSVSLLSHRFLRKTAYTFSTDALYLLLPHRFLRKTAYTFSTDALYFLLPHRFIRKTAYTFSTDAPGVAGLTPSAGNTSSYRKASNSWPQHP
jgi:hypothetical protein